MSRARVIVGDCRASMATLPDASVDAVVCDPPYELGFMGKAWDASGIAYDLEVWRQALRVLKPGGHLLAFSGSRTYHRMTCAIEDAGFEIRDQIMWVYGSGFPKSLDVSKAIDKHGGADVSWFGPWFRAWREKNGITQKQVAALFPSKTGNFTGCVANWELGFNLPTPDQFNAICAAFQLPFDSIAAAERAILETRHDAGNRTVTILGADARDYAVTAPATDAARRWSGWGTALKPAHEPICVARKPLDGTVAANVLKHGTGAINVDGCRVGTDGGTAKGNPPRLESNGIYGHGINGACDIVDIGKGRWPANLIHDGSDEATAPLGEAARFFYTAKASSEDRDEMIGDPPSNNHPTVKPTELMRYLVRMVTPLGGTVLDPFTGSGSTGRAAMLEGARFIGCELSPEYAEIARARIRYTLGPLFAHEVE